MASLDSLPADQRAVLQLVLQRGRSYDEIAQLLKIDRAAVRERALMAFDLLGPHTGVPDQRRALITDYLLGQLPPRISEQTRDRLAQSPSERAWARVLASEIVPLARGALPEIPSERSRATAREDERASAGPAAREAAGAATAATPPPAPAPTPQSNGEPPTPGRTGSGRTSRRGGALLIGLGVVAAVVVAIVLLSSGSSKKKPAASTPASSTAAANSTGTTSTATSSTAAANSTATSSTATSSTAAHVIAQINLTPPAAGSKAAGIAEVLKQGNNDGIAIVAQNVPPNTTKPPNAYAVWLYNSPTDAHILGFVNPGVSSTGRLSTAGALPANAAHYKQLIVTVETKADPKAPGTIILQGALTGLS